MKKGYLLVFLAASMWGTLGIFAKLLYQFNLDTFTVVFYRVLIAFFLLLVYNFSKGLKIKKERLPFYAFYGFFSIFLFYVLYFYTVKISSVSLAVLLLYTAPIHSTILGYFIFKERITSIKSTALIMAVVGVLFVVNPNNEEVSALAVALGLLSGFTYALYGILGKIAVRNERPEEALLYTIGFGALFLLPFSDFRIPLNAVPYLFALAFFPTFLAYILYNTALKEVEVSKASIIATIEPVVALVLAYLIFNETLTLKQLFGAALIIGGSMLVHLDEVLV
ncbi:EamA family transporter [Thermococcus sp. M39]|uniref:EamA family transporter n=1 Tax=unclassified Thermococcus TaxID=2627626 RepID=UPI00143AB929|nr:MULTISPECIES: EamA family transporter [unclassified Thermococcus]NJE08220.1 EamA family transporter [Thermococcus sp. M39]NJE11713.1 EamA family transporter [Thermococcus sp. LS2]